MPQRISGRFGMRRQREPAALRRGKAFHKMVQREWLQTAKDGEPRPERYVRRLDRKRGRVDILVEKLGDFVSIIEIKASDWDRMSARNVVRNVRRQIRQVWSYVAAQVELFDHQVCPGIIFQKMPKDETRLQLIETMFNGEGIQVVWHDEFTEGLWSRMLPEGGKKGKATCKAP
jgi:hypothetical protein